MPTRAQVEDVLVLEHGGLLVATELTTDPDADTVPRAYLRGPLSAALRAMGRTVASPAAPTDAEVENAAATPAGLEELLARVKLAVLERAVLSSVLVNEQAGTDRQDKGTLAAQVRAELDRHRDRVADLYGEPGGPTAGPIKLGFQAVWPSEGA
jgi:hypothetical protein